MNNLYAIVHHYLLEMDETEPCDEVLGYVETEDEAKAYCEKYKDFYKDKGHTYDHWLEYCVIKKININIEPDNYWLEGCTNE